MGKFTIACDIIMLIIGVAGFSMDFAVGSYDVYTALSGYLIGFGFCALIYDYREMERSICN